jgi:hypothetical protein
MGIVIVAIVVTMLSLLSYDILVQVRPLWSLHPIPSQPSIHLLCARAWCRSEVSRVGWWLLSTLGHPKESARELSTENDVEHVLKPARRVPAQASYLLFLFISFVHYFLYLFYIYIQITLYKCNIF